ncbi:MAG: Appr-1-p processing protein [SAR202 cluster bacterium]|nr:Appr-1-p processing protein [SAR202 cluster bacterium]
MITVLIGDLFESQSQTLVNTVNCVGVMGKGVALGFKQRFPDMYVDYVARCNAGQVKLGQPYLYRQLLPPWILNFPTKDHWRSVARLQDIVQGLHYLQAHYKEWGITSLAVPPLGCGEGQLEWRVVGPTLYRNLRELDLPVELYAPYGTPLAELKKEFLTQSPELAVAGPGQGRIQPAWVALVEILARVAREPYHWPVGRTTFQKMAYFATESGLPTGLTFSRGSYGPYALSLKSRVTQLVNNGLILEERLGPMFEVKPGPTFEDAQRAYQADIKQFDPVIDRVADLFLRVQTRQAEVAATVHFAAATLAKQLDRRPFEQEVLAHVREWKQGRRPPLDESEIATTVRNLAVLRWIDVESSQDLPIPKEQEAALGV